LPLLSKTGVYHNTGRATKRRGIKVKAEVEAWGGEWASFPDRLETDRNDDLLDIPIFPKGEH
jgi:hypothetical protein